MRHIGGYGTLLVEGEGCRRDNHHRKAGRIEKTREIGSKTLPGPRGEVHGERCPAWSRQHSTDRLALPDASIRSVRFEPIEKRVSGKQLSEISAQRAGCGGGIHRETICTGEPRRGPGARAHDKPAG
jgi:hypothetical protein